MFGLPPETAKKLMLSVGTHRTARHLTPLEAAAAMRQAMDNGASARDVAAALHFDGTTMVGRFLKLLSLSLDVQPLVDWGSGPSSLAFSAAVEIARLPGPEQPVAARAALEHQFGLSEIKQLLQIRQRSGKRLEEVIAAVLEQRPQITQRHVIVGAIVSDGVQAELSRLSQEERNTLLRRALEKHAPALVVAGAKLGANSFTLVGDKRFQAALVALPNGFEEAVTRYLQQELSEKG